MSRVEVSQGRHRRHLLQIFQPSGSLCRNVSLLDTPTYDVVAAYNFHWYAEEDRDIARVGLRHFGRTIYITDILCARNLYRAALHRTEADRFTAHKLAQL